MGTSLSAFVFGGQVLDERTNDFFPRRFPASTLFLDHCVVPKGIGGHKANSVNDMQTNAATIVFIPHNDLERAQTRLQRDLAPSLRHYPDWSFELIVIDNSERRLDPLAEEVAHLPWPSHYLWHDGTNLFYGPALNVAASLARFPVMLYLC